MLENLSLESQEVPAEASVEAGTEPAAVETTGDAVLSKSQQKRAKLKAKAEAAKADGGDQAVAAAPSTAVQTAPPTVPVRHFFPEGKYPEGEWQSYRGDYASRENSAESRELERLQWDMLNEVRQAAEVHRQVRSYIHTIAKPGIKLSDMCETLESSVRSLIEERGLAAGIAFPTGCSLNHVAAHYTPNGGDNTVLTYDDVMKIDFGTQIGGRIIDSAFTVHFNPKFDPLVEAVKEATNTGVREAGIDVRLCDIGAAVQEVGKLRAVDNRGGAVHELRLLSVHV